MDQYLKAFNEDLKCNRQLWSPEVSTAVDPDVIRLKDGMVDPLACWDAHLPQYNKTAGRFKRKISKDEKMHIEEMFSFLQLGYVLFARAE